MAVLGALSTGPMTGYAVREAIRDVLGHFWSESFGQIYPTLATLERDGFVTRTDEGYEITPAGVDRLRDLLRQPIQSVPPRNGLLLRVFFGRMLGVRGCRTMLSESRDEARKRLEYFDRLAVEVASEPAGPDQRYWLMTISAGRHTARANIAWADECLAILGRS